jgi:hypothetical protein
MINNVGKIPTIAPLESVRATARIVIKSKTTNEILYVLFSARVKEKYTKGRSIVSTNPTSFSSTRVPGPWPPLVITNNEIDSVVKRMILLNSSNFAELLTKIHSAMKPKRKLCKE